MDYDDLLNILGKSGRYQLLLVGLLSFPTFVSVFLNLSIVFVAGIPEHWCHVPGLDRFNLTQQQMCLVSIPFRDDSFASCQMYDRNYSSWTEADVAAALDEDPATLSQQLSTVKCHQAQGWDYDRSQFQSTIVSEWDLVCDYHWMRATVSSVYYAGMMAGGVVVGVLSDVFGRKPLACITAVLTFVTSLAMAFSPNYTTFAVLRFFVGLFQFGLYMSCYVLMIESMPPSWRVHASIFNSGYLWCIGYLAVGGICYAIRDWFKLQLVMALPSVLMLTYLCFLTESPRWLYTKLRPRKADAIVRKIAAFNKVELPEKLEVTIKSSSKGYFWDILRTPRMRLRSSILFFVWFVISLVYYGLSLNTSNLGGNDYLNFSISGAVEIPANAFCHFSMTYLGRRWSLCVAMILGGVALFAILGVPSGMTWLVITLGMLGKFGITLAFSIIYVLTAEIYPTTVRTVGLGSGSFCARVGGIIAPFIAELGTTNQVIPPLLFGVASIAAGLLVLLLPETKGKHLPDTLKDGEEFGEDCCTSCFCCCCPITSDGTAEHEQAMLSTSARGNVYIEGNLEAPHPVLPEESKT